MAVPLFSKRSLMPCAPDLAADTSSTPESMSSTRDRAVSKLLFMVVAITPVGPVFTQPLQYRPGETLKASKLNVVSLIPTAFFFKCSYKNVILSCIFLKNKTKRCSPYLQLAELGPFCWGLWPCGCRTAPRHRLTGSCSRCCWWSDHRPRPPPLQWALRAHPPLSPARTQVPCRLGNLAIPSLPDS